MQTRRRNSDLRCIGPGSSRVHFDEAAPMPTAVMLGRLGGLATRSRRYEDAKARCRFRCAKGR
uniref:Uncharacterized protein n=1 Tax=Ralstonia solanacearum TaxID=305 RepID=A0A0S4WQG3_RALSL|nr:protein of unknown function [Ralstonia solanacearum]